MGQRLRASRKLLEEGQKIILGLLNECSISKATEKLQQLYQSTDREENKDYQIKRYLECEPLEGEYFDEISQFIQSNFPSFNYKHYSKANPTHRSNGKLTADMAALITTTQNELYLEEDLRHDPQKLWTLYVSCLQETSKNDLFSTDFPEHPKGQPYLISVDKLRWEIKSNSMRENITEIKLLAKIKSKLITWGRAFVNNKTGSSRLLLDHRPFMWTGKPLTVSNKRYYNLQLENNSFTTKAIEFMEQAIKEKFEGKLHITNYGGWLKDGNLKKFRDSYEKFSNLSQEDRIEKAYKQTSFGKNRNKLGITDIEIEILDYDCKNLPTAVFVPVARRPIQ